MDSKGTATPVDTGLTKSDQSVGDHFGAGTPPEPGSTSEWTNSLGTSLELVPNLLLDPGCPKPP